MINETNLKPGTRFHLVHDEDLSMIQVEGVTLRNGVMVLEYTKPNDGHSEIRQVPLADIGVKPYAKEGAQQRIFWSYAEALENLEAYLERLDKEFRDEMANLA